MYASPAPAMGQYPGQYYAPAAPKKNNTCTYSICSLIVFTTIIYAIYSTVPYLNPQSPQISIADFSVIDFDMNDANLTAQTKFTVDLNITNPNLKVGMESKPFSALRLNYKNVKLCNGTMPMFKQDVHSSKVVRVPLAGTGTFDESTKAYLDGDVENGKVQLDLSAVFTVVTVVDGKPKQSRDIVCRCQTVVDNVDPRKEVRILSSTCKFKW